MDALVIFLEGLKIGFDLPYQRGPNIHPHTTVQNPGPPRNSLATQHSSIVLSPHKVQLNPELLRKEFVWEEGTGLSPSPAKPEPL